MNLLSFDPIILKWKILESLTLAKLAIKYDDMKNYKILIRYAEQNIKVLEQFLKRRSK